MSTTGSSKWASIALLAACGGSAAPEVQSPLPSEPPGPFGIAGAPRSGADSGGYGYMFDVDSAANATAAAAPTSLPLGPGGRLYPEAISGVVRTHFGALLTCYYAGLKREPKLAGMVTMRYVLGEDGTPKEVADEGSTLPDKEVIGCILEKFRDLRYPASKGGDVKVVYPMQFAPTDLVTRQPAPLRPL